VPAIVFDSLASRPEVRKLGCSLGGASGSACWAKELDWEGRGAERRRGEGVRRLGCLERR
jgi:hypothetical protein